GFTAQTWDIAGNEANFFVRDVTGGSRLPFRIRPGAPTSSIDIDASGEVGIGTASPRFRTHILGANASPSLTAVAGIVAIDGGTGTNELTIGTFSGTPFGVWLQAKDNASSGAGSGSSYPILLNPLGGSVGIGTTAPTLALS